MQRHPRPVLLGLVLFAAAAHADEAPPVQPLAAARDFARARGADARDLLLGTPPPQVAEPLHLDCDQLYHQRLALMRDQLDAGPTDFYSDPRVGAGVFVGSVWAPGLYYLPFRAVQNFRDQTRRPQRAAELDALRARSAAQRCFER